MGADDELCRGRDVVPRRCRRTAPVRDPLLGSRLAPAVFAGVGLGLLGSAAFSTEYADTIGVEHLFLDADAFDPAGLDDAMCQALLERRIDLVVLAGYL